MTDSNPKVENVGTLPSDHATSTVNPCASEPSNQHVDIPFSEPSLTSEKRTGREWIGNHNGESPRSSPSVLYERKKWKRPKALMKQTILSSQVPDCLLSRRIQFRNLCLRKLFWTQFLTYLVRKGIKFSPFPHLAWEHVDLYRLYHNVQLLGGPAAFSCQPPIRTLRDELGREITWSRGLETVYENLGLTAFKDSEPSRRIRLLQIYDRYFSCFTFDGRQVPTEEECGIILMSKHQQDDYRGRYNHKNGWNNAGAINWEDFANSIYGKRAGVRLNTSKGQGSPNDKIEEVNDGFPIEYARCACGHSHELPEPEGMSCKTCRQRFPENIQCRCCGAWQHVACLVNFGFLTPEEADGWDGPLARTFLCELCYGGALRMKPRRVSFHTLFGDTLMRWELPHTWVVEYSYLDISRFAVKLNYYILRGIDVYEGRGSPETICSERHLKEVLAGQEKDPRSYQSGRPGHLVKRHKRRNESGLTVNNSPPGEEEGQGQGHGSQQQHHLDPLFQSSICPSNLAPVTSANGVLHKPKSPPFRRPFTPTGNGMDILPVTMKTPGPPPRTASVLCVADVSAGKEIFPIPARGFTAEDTPLVGMESYVIDYFYGLGVTEPPPNPPGCECIDRCNTSSCPCVAQHQSQRPAYNERGELILLDEDVIVECSGACKCSASCGNRVVQAGVRHRLEVFQTDGKGWGLRALERIPRGSFVCSYEGELVTEETAHRRGFAYDHTYEMSYLMDLNLLAPDHLEDRCLTIDSTLYGNVARFINHGCEPNLHKQMVYTTHRSPLYYKLALFADKDLDMHEELAYDYGYEVGSVRGKYILCRCGAASCRGRLL